MKPPTPPRRIGIFRRVAIERHEDPQQPDAAWLQPRARRWPWALAVGLGLLAVVLRGW